MQFKQHNTVVKLLLLLL